MASLDVITKMPWSRKALLFVLVLLLIGAGYYLLRYSELEKKLDKQKDDRASTEAALVQAANDFRDFETLVRDLEAARAEIQKLKDVLPSDRDIEGLMTTISAQAKAARLRLTNIVPEDEQEGPDGYYIKLPIKIEFRGTYHQVLHFFHLVDTGVERLVNLENIRLERDPSKEEPNLLKGSVRAMTFMAKEPSSGQQGTAPGSPPPQ